MNSMMQKMFKAAIFLSAFIILTGCINNGSFAVNAKEVKKRSAWLTYWDLAAGEGELEKAGGKLAEISYFGAYFAENDGLFLPEELAGKRNGRKIRRIRYETYLTIVNDKQNPDGSVALKDIDVLRRVLADDAAMEKHIDEILALTLQGGYDGMEIDYEKLWTDEKVARSFITFTEKLYAKARRNNLKLRIVLEPSAPFNTAGFFKGPEYVVMFYNLYGLHSTPGPKANKAFIQKMITRMQALPGEKSIALSTGGCVWGDNGDKRFITEGEAKVLATVYGAEMRRDGESQCLVFDYQAKDVNYQVWYADMETINFWISVAKERGMNNISLWRLGGNVDIRKLN